MMAATDNVSRDEIRRVACAGGNLAQNQPRINADLRESEQ
jgi:hypothetical protein